ncbi:MAG: hypothetical protein WBA68_07295 [Alteraurantiacibacter sp.]
MSARAAPVTLAPLVLVTCLTLLPPQTALNLGGIVMPFYRAGLIFAFPWLLYVWGKRGTRLHPLDGLMGFAIAWIFIALSVTESGQRALVNGGSSAIDIGIAYFLARVSLPDPTALRRFLILLAPAFLLVAGSVALETLSGRYIVQPFFVQVFGAAEESFILADTEPRFGLLRGAGSFPHPILAGLHLGSLLSLYYLSAVRGWPRVVGVAASLSALFTLSSSALLMLSGQVVAIAYDRLTRTFAQATWRLFLGIVAVVILVLELGTERGAVRVMLELTALNSWTAYYRTLIWEHGVANVLANPVFGIGFADWVRPAWMPPSVDNYWLLVAMQYGLPEGLARFALPFAGACLLAMRSRHLPEPDRSTLRGLAISLLLFTLLGFSVALWNNTQAWFYIVTGATVSLALFARQRSVTEPRDQPIAEATPAHA